MHTVLGKSVHHLMNSLNAEKISGGKICIADTLTDSLRMFSAVSTSEMFSCRSSRTEGCNFIK